MPVFTKKMCIQYLDCDVMRNVNHSPKEADMSLLRVYQISSSVNL